MPSACTSRPHLASNRSPSNNRPTSITHLNGTPLPKQIRVTYLTATGLQQTWNMQVAESVSPEQILAQLRAERPDIHTVQSIEQVGATSAPGPWQAPPARRRRGTHRRNGLVISAVVVVASVLITVIGVYLSNRRDEPSYAAGAEVGTRYAQQFIVISADPLSDSLLKDACETFAVYDMYEEFNGDDFIDGCIDGARTVAPG